MDLHLIHIEIKDSGTHFCNRVDNILHSTQNTNPFSKEKESAVAAHVTKKYSTHKWYCMARSSQVMVRIWHGVTFEPLQNKRFKKRLLLMKAIEKTISSIYGTATQNTNCFSIEKERVK